MVNTDQELDTHDTVAVFFGMSGGKSSNRIAEFRSLLKWSQADLARALGNGTEQATISRLESGKMNLTAEWMRDIAKALSTPDRPVAPSDLLHPDDSKPFATRTENVLPFQREKQFLTGDQDLPILGHAKGGEEGFFIDNGDIAGYTMRPYLLNGVRDAYAVNIWDTSMEPAFKHGHIAWVHPRKPVKAGDDVVVQLKDGQALIKCLVRQTEKELVLHQYKPEQDIRIPQSQVKSIHLVVGSIRVAT